MTPIIRLEASRDADAVRRVHEAAFGRPDEADVVDRLRARATPYLGFVAVAEGDVVGHVAYSPLTLLPEQPALSLLGLAPMAIRPDHQHRGIGTALVQQSLRACRAAGVDAVFVLGHAAYYARFGFQPVAQVGIENEYGAPPEAFMAAELRPGALDGVTGIARYHPALEG